MSRYNRFGSAYTDVMGLYPGTVVTDYDQGGASGQTRIEAAMDRACRRFAMALSPDVYRQMTKVDAEQPVRYATSGQATFVLGLGPMVANTLHVWRYPSLYAVSIGVVEGFTQAPQVGLLEEPTPGTSTAGAVVTVTPTTTLALGERMFASYDVDVDNTSFAMPSIADLCLYGAATELGALLYSNEQQEWKLVDEYRKRWDDALKAAAEGAWVPDELRKLTYWQEVERSSNEVRSIHRPRG